MGKENSKQNLDTIASLVSRIETRMVNGFIRMGVDPCTKVDPQAMDIDLANRTIRAHSPSLTIGDIMRKLNQVGAPPGAYTVHSDGCRDLLFIHREVPDD